MDILVLSLESFIGLFKSDGSKNSSFSAKFEFYLKFYNDYLFA